MSTMGKEYNDLGFYLLQRVDVFLTNSIIKTRKCTCTNSLHDHQAIINRLKQHRKEITAQLIKHVPENYSSHF